MQCGTQELSVAGTCADGDGLTSWVDRVERKLKVLHLEHMLPRVGRMLGAVEAHRREYHAETLCRLLASCQVHILEAMEVGNATRKAG